MPCYVEFVPDASWDVVLTGFDIESWSTSNYPNSPVRMVDALGATLFDSGLFTFPGNTVRQYMATPIRSSSALRLVGAGVAGWTACARWAIGRARAQGANLG